GRSSLGDDPRRSRWQLGGRRPGGAVRAASRGRQGRARAGGQRPRSGAGRERDGERHGMRALEFVEKGKLEWRDAPEPKVEGDGQAVVKPVALATCDVDVAFVQGLAPAGGS